MPKHGYQIVFSGSHPMMTRLSEILKSWGIHVYIRWLTTYAAVRIMSHSGCRTLIDKVFEQPHVLKLERKDSLCRFFQTFTVKQGRGGTIFDNGAHLAVFNPSNFFLQTWP